MSNGKFSFSLAGASKSAPAGGQGPSMSNLQLLMAKAKGVAPAHQKSKANLLGDEDEDDITRKAPEAGPSKTNSKLNLASGSKTNILMSRSERRAHDEALRIDQSVFDYDGVYDGMKAAERALDDARKAESTERKPKYIENFLVSAQTRRLDRLRAEEKMLQLEREKEGDEFADKEKFVTEAYKKQMAEVRKAEEEEKIREDMARKSNKGPGLTALYKSMLDTDEAKHAAAVAATSHKAIGPSLVIKPPAKMEYDDEEEYDPMLAREARMAAGSASVSATTGKQIEINDEGEVVDKRSLLKAGLNIMKKPKPQLPSSLLTSQRNESASTNEPYVSRAVGTAASYQERMARERQRLAEQVREQEEKKRALAEQRARDEEEAARKRREGNDGEADRRRQEAKERFLARKRAREEAEAEAKKKIREI